MPVVVKRIVNPQGSRRKAARKPAKRTPNPVGELITLGVINPERRTKVQRKKKHGTVKKHTSARKAKRTPNPSTAKPRRSAKRPAAAPKKHRRSTNPSGFNLLKKPIEVLKLGATAGVGFFATQKLPQMALGARNSGPIGYGANIIAAMITAALASKIQGANAGAAVLIGGGLYTVQRIASEQWTPLGTALRLSGVGDAMAHGRAPGMGRLVPGSFPLPVVTDRNGRMQVPAAYTAAAVDAVRALPPASPAAPSLSGGRFSGSRARR